MRDESILDHTEAVPSGCPDMSCPRNCRSLAQSCIALCKVGLPFDQNQEDTHASSVGSGFDLRSPDRKTKALKMVTVALLVSLLSFGVYRVGQLGEKSLWRTAAVCWAYVSSSIQPLQQQVTPRFLQIKTGTVATLAGHSGEGQVDRTPVSLQLVALHAADKEQWPAGDEFGEALSNTLSLQEQLRKLQEELYHLRWSVKDVAERALHEALKQAKLPGFTGWAVQEIINQVLKKLEENQVPMPDYALKSSGAAVVHSRTSPSFRTTKGKVFFYSLPVLDHMRSPELILEPENHPGNCWPFPGSQGHVFVKLSEPIIPRAVTMDHVSGTAFHGDSISRAPKDFAVYGLKEEHEEQGTFLGQFTFQAVLNPRQTFQLKKELSGFANYVRLQVLSNWGHPAYTCLYRFRVHGDPLKDGGRASVLY
ncbi:SUN domain-containing protein 3 [Pelecanus crispus]|uniref:SUN domain-containing protein 3 n=1 Tax=Pelecanus crispus TaxID=36300 RepID=UPI003F5D3C60